MQNVESGAVKGGTRGGACALEMTVVVSSVEQAACERCDEEWV